MLHRLAFIPLAGLLALAGCVGVQGARVAASPDRAVVEVEPVDPAAWPQRLRTQDAQLGIIQTEQSPWLRPGRLPPGGFLEPDQRHADDARALARAAGLDQAGRFEFEGPGSLVFDPEDELPDLAAGEPRALFRFVSARPRPDGLLEVQRTWFAYFPAQTETTRALAVLLPGMLGTPAGLIDDLAGKLTSDGYAVLRMLAHPSRFTEHATLTATPDLNASAAIAADTLTNRAAEAAFATEAAVTHVLRIDPTLEGLPRVAIGMSGGAMILTTVMARDPGDWAAAVSIAGGSNYWLIQERSNYADFIGAFDQEWVGLEPDEENVQRFAQAYLDHAPLDSFHAARAVAHVPFLVLHGSLDKAVPAEQGDQLWLQLGQPERWTSPVGHELLFWFLPTQFDDILAWLDQYVPGGERNESSSS